MRGARDAKREGARLTCSEAQPPRDLGHPSCRLARRFLFLFFVLNILVFCAGSSPGSARARAVARLVHSFVGLFEQISLPAGAAPPRSESMASGVINLPLPVKPWIACARNLARNTHIVAAPRECLDISHFRHVARPCSPG